jgi:hypothetical protein
MLVSGDGLGMGGAVAVGGHGRWGVGMAHVDAVVSRILQGGVQMGRTGGTCGAPVGSPVPGSSLCSPSPLLRLVSFAIVRGRRD